MRIMDWSADVCSSDLVNVVFKRRTQELDLFEMGDKSFERIECSEKWVCNEAQTAQFGDEFTLVRRKRLAQFAGCICEEAKAAFSGFCWIFLANRSCRSVSGIGEELLSELRPSFVDC